MKRVLLLLILFFIQEAFFAQEIDIELFQDGFTRPLNIQNAGDERLFVVEQGGKIKIIQGNGSVNTAPFLDISDQISSGNERGLLGLTFHPEYSSNGFFYVNYTNIDGDSRISRFSVDIQNPEVANSDSEFPIIGYTQPNANHNGGALAFGPDGYLYISSGDGGGSGDPNNNGQSLNTLLGKILRIDVDNSSSENNYAIPPDNPFVDNDNARPEIWAYGLRNPWRFSFDETENQIWIADVGQAEIEEINKQPINSGGNNYGWRCYEGDSPFNTQDCPPLSAITFPFAQYTHDSGNCSITGGYVYRGSKYSDIEGLYFFADYCSGMIGTVDNGGNMETYGNFPGMWVSFGEDTNRELYIVDIDGGKIYKIKGGETAATENVTRKVSFKVFPNPASEVVYLSTYPDQIQNIKIMDIQGRLIFQETNLNISEKKIPVSSFDPGIYFIQASTAEGNIFSKKIIIR